MSRRAAAALLVVSIVGGGASSAIAQLVPPEDRPSAKFKRQISRVLRHDASIDRPGLHETHLGAELVRVPFDDRRRFVAVRVRVNGRGPYWFNVDTYASIGACVDRTLARELDLPIVGAVPNTDGSGSTVERSLARIDTLVLGEAEFRAVDALVDDYTWVPAPDGTPVRGLLGFRLFAELLWTVDYPNRELRMTRGALDYDEDHVVRYSVVRGAPDIEVRIADSVVVAGIDTGFVDGLYVSEEQLRALDTVRPPRQAGTARTAYVSSVPVFSGQLAAPVTFAGHEIPHVRALGSRQRKLPLVGFGLLSAYAVTFDGPNRLVRFLPRGVVEPEKEYGCRDPNPLAGFGVAAP